MMRWLRIGLLVLSGIATLLFVVVALLVNVDFGRYSGKVEDYVSTLLARELRIDGVVHANLGSSIELYAEDVFLANPEWATNPTFVSARKIDIVVDAWSLFGPSIIVERVEIDGLRINIELNEQGAASWDFDGLQSVEQVPEETAEPVRKRFPAIFELASITGSKITFTSPVRDEMLVLVVDGITTRVVDEYVQTRLQGSLDGTPVHLEQRSGPVQNILDYRMVETTLTGDLGEISITASAFVDDVLAPKRPRASIGIKGPNAEYLADILHIDLVTTGPLDILATVEPRDDLLTASIHGAFGEFQVDIDGHTVDLQNTSDVQFDVSAGGPSIGTVIKLVGGKYSDLDPFQIDGHIRLIDDDLTIDDVRVSVGQSRLAAEGFFGEFPTLKNARLSATATGDDYGRFNRLFGLPGRIGGQFTMSLSLDPEDDGRTAIRLDASCSEYKLQLTANVQPDNQYIGTAADMAISGPDIGLILEKFGYERPLKEAWDISVKATVDDTGYRLDKVKMLFGDDVVRIDGHIGNDPLGSATNLNVEIAGTDLGASIVALGGSADMLPKGAFHLKGGVLHRDEKLILNNIEAALGDKNEYQLAVTGFIANNASFESSEISVKARGASLAALAEINGIEGIPDMPFDVSAELKRGKGRTFARNGKIEIGKSKLEFSGDVGDSPLEEDIALAFTASIPNLQDGLSKFDIPRDDIPAVSVHASGELRRSSSRLMVDKLVIALNDATIDVKGNVGDLPDFQGTRLKIAASGARLKTLFPESFSATYLEHPFKLSASLEVADHVVSVSELNGRLGNSEVLGNLAVGMKPVLGTGRFNIRAKSPDLWMLLPELGENDVQGTAPMSFAAAGDWAERYWHFDNLALSLGEGKLQIIGAIEAPPSFDRTDLKVEWHSPSIHNLSKLAGRELPDQALNLTARLKGDHTQMTMESFNLSVGNSDLNGHFTMIAGDVPQLDIVFRSSLIDITEFQPPKETEAEKPPSKKADRLIPDTPLELDFLRNFDATIDINIAKLVSRAFVLGDLALQGLVKDGDIEVPSLRLVGRRNGVLTSSAELKQDADGLVNARISINGADLAMGFIAETEEDVAMLPVYELATEISASGKTVRELAGTANGYFRMLGGKGRLKSGSLEILTGDFLSQLLSAINPFSKTDPYSHVDCAAVLLSFDNGVVNGEPAVVAQTDKLRVFGNTKIDLKTEKIDAAFRTVPQKGLGLSLSNLVNPYIKLSGTLASPSLGLNAESVLIEGGAAVATGGITILAKAFNDRFLSGKDPCGKAVAEADKAWEAKRKVSKPKR